MPNSRATIAACDAEPPISVIMCPTARPLGSVILVTKTRIDVLSALAPGYTA
ncbi:hypothetical protein [Nocardia sp. NPDC049707]|uniref:hypothetical protein n=1 Tax=Nocardia sp. NPDC049707 TaxID=3154735 RepID=UPI00341DB376